MVVKKNSKLDLPALALAGLALSQVYGFASGINAAAQAGIPEFRTEFTESVGRTMASAPVIHQLATGVGGLGYIAALELNAPKRTF